MVTSSKYSKSKQTRKNMFTNLLPAQINFIKSVTINTLCRPFSSFATNSLYNKDNGADAGDSSVVSEDSVSVTVSLSESDFIESFIKGSGPGGSKVNKTKNCVELKHIESGIVVQCHESRTLKDNRKLARIRLLEQLKQRYTPSESDLHKKKEEKKKRKGDAQRKRNLKEEALKNEIDW